MKRYAFVKYNFLVDLNDFQHKSDVDKLLSDSFNAKGYQLRILDVISGSGGEGLICIEKKDVLDSMVQQPQTLIPTPPATPGRPQTMKGRVKELTQHIIKPAERNFKKGKLLKSKGYIKR